MFIDCLIKFDVGESQIRFIRSQKKNAQLVYKGYIYNKKLSQVNGQTTWRCADVLKMRCKAVIITKRNELVAARREHNHIDHKERIGQRALYKEEEDLGDVVELNADNSTPTTSTVTLNTATVSEVTLLSTHDGQRNIKEYKLFVPATTNKQQQE